MSEIYDVDLSVFESGTPCQRDNVVNTVMTSLKTGFVYTSHDLTEDLLDAAYGALEAFFSLDAEVKQTAIVPGANSQAGYTGPLTETAAASQDADWKEMLAWGTELPAGHPLRSRFPNSYGGIFLPENLVPGITKTLTEFSKRILDIQRRFLRIIAVGIGCHETFFDAMTLDGATKNRAIHYPAMGDAPGGNHIWAGEHGDIDLITALPRATERGLQIKLSDDNGDTRWVDAAPPEGRMIINTGIMLDRITNGMIPPGLHRVIADEHQRADRYSVVQFCHPTPWTILSPVTSCITADNPQRHAPIAAGDLLSQVLHNIKLID